MSLLTIINSLLYSISFVLFILYSKRKGKPVLRVGTIVLGLYMIISIIAMLLYDHPLAPFTEVHLFPFLYLYLSFLIIVYPILRFDEIRMKNFHMPSKVLMNCLSMLAVMIALITSVGTLQSLPKLFDLFGDMSIINDEYLDSRDNTGSGPGNIFRTFNYLFSYLYLLFLFFYLSLKNKSSFDKILIFALGISLLLSAISNLFNGLRGPIMFLIFDIVFFFVLFFQRFNTYTRKIAYKISIIFLLILLSGIITITIGRFGEDSYNSSQGIDITYGIEYYAGQSPLYFNNYGLDAGGIRDGDKTFPLIRKLMGLEYSKHWMDRRFNYSTLKIDDSVFATFIGDFTIDFGPFVAFIFFLLLLVFNSTILLSEKNGTDMSQILVLYILYIVCTHGFALYPFSELGGNRTLLFMLFIAYVFYIDRRVRIFEK